MKKTLLGRISMIAILSVSMAACQKDQSLVADNTAVSQEVMLASGKGSVPGDVVLTFYALSGNVLDKYSTANPETIISSASISGLQPGERILGIDFRPLTGQLYGLGSNSRLYTINPETGLATFVAPLTTAMTPTTAAGVPVLLSGTSFGVDFNPSVDRLRVISNTGQNLRIVPTTGATFIDGSINPQPASINGVAYDNNSAGATPTELYALDVTTDTQYDILPPNAGTLVNPLSIALKIEGDGGFDIAPRRAAVTTDIGLALYEVNKKSTLFLIDSETGETRILAKYNKSIMYSGLAISPLP